MIRLPPSCPPQSPTGLKVDFISVAWQRPPPDLQRDDATNDETALHASLPRRQGQVPRSRLGLKRLPRRLTTAS